MAIQAVSAYDQWLARREEHRRICAAGGDDRLSALPDDVIRLILRCLNTRSALATAALSKHWSRFRRELPVLEFKVSDILPERYYRYLRRRQDTTTGDHKKLDISMSRYERRSMRSMAVSLNSFLDADEGQRRSAHAMTLELFPGHNTGPLNRLVAKAVGDWGVEALEIVVLPCHGHGVSSSYSFPHHCFDDDDLKCPTHVVLKKLKLTNCTPLPAGPQYNADGSPAAFSSLTVLILQDMPKWTRGRVYQRIVRACPKLEVLHLKSCVFWDLESISIDAPASQIRELVVDGCTFVSITLRSLPRLERLALVGAPVGFTFGSLPRLTHLNLSFYQDPNLANNRHPLFPDMRSDYSVFSFIDPSGSSSFRDLESLVVRFTGPENWVVPIPGLSLGNVKRLLLADMPHSWDIAWTCRLLEAAPYLETLHVHFTDQDHYVGMAVDPAIPRPPSDFKNRALREVVIAGFKATGKLVRFVRFLITKRRGTLENVTLLKHGRGREMEHWDSATPEQEQCQWSDEDRDALLKEIQQDGNASSTTRILLGYLPVFGTYDFSETIITPVALRPVPMKFQVMVSMTLVC